MRADFFGHRFDMAGSKNSKRGRDDDAATGVANGGLPSRNKRAKYSDQDAKLAAIYNDLADEVQSVRIKAAGELLKDLSSESADRAERLDAAESRLIKGLCSGRKAARLGFSVALAELFRLRCNIQRGDAAGVVSLQQTIDNITKLTTVHGNVSGQERREYGLGRRFALQAVLQSDVGLDQHLSEDEWRALVKAILDLASQKPWLRRECGTLLYEYLSSNNGAKLSKDRVSIIVDELVSYKFLKAPEGVGLWITVQRQFPEVKLPKDVWHHRDPLSSRDREVLVKVMVETATDDEPQAKTSGSRQSIPSFVWTVVLSELFQRGETKAFVKFWESAARWLFAITSSAERKALGLQILSYVFSNAPEAMLSEPLRAAGVLQCILDQRAKPDRYLFDAAKVPLQRAVMRAKSEQQVAGARGDQQVATIFITSFIMNGAPHLDQLTKTKTIEELACIAGNRALEDVVFLSAGQFAMPELADESEVQNRRRALVDLLVNSLRARARAVGVLQKTEDGQTSLDSSASATFRVLASTAYSGSGGLDNPPITESTRATVKSRLMSCLSVLVEQPLETASVACLQVINILSQLGKNSRSRISPDASKAISQATALATETAKFPTQDNATRAFQLLLCLSIVQVYNAEPDSLAALQDLIDFHRSGEGQDASTLLVELLLSFVSKPSALFRRLAEQVFTAFAPQLTADGMQSFVDILEQREDLSGQQALFQDGDEGMDQNGGVDEEEVEIDLDGEVIDAEELSDVEIVNGLQVAREEVSGGEVEDEDEASDESSESSSEVEGGAEDDDIADDEVAAFDAKLAAALGTSGADNNQDSDSDSDMDDEQMMALEPHLTSIFAERAKEAAKSTTKQDKRDAKTSIVNFKNRVLDLLAIYVKSQHAAVLALDLVIPLARLTRTSSSKPTTEKAFAVLKTYFDACAKTKRLPVPEDAEACFAVLAEVHEEMKLGGSKLHANACSRSSLFLCRVLVAMDRGFYERVAGMYAALQSEWYADGKSKMAARVFTEWTSWSIATRKKG